MEFIDYRKNEVDEVLAKELDWKYYGGHHHENLYTRFFQAYYLPEKFKIDKRKTELSALVRSGQISREDALEEISHSDYIHDDKTVAYAIHKLGLTQEEFDKIVNLPVKSHDDYKTYLPLMRLLRFPIRIAAKLRLVPHILYLKYTG